MTNRLAKTLLSAAVAALALPAGAQAKHGADDPVGHVRHASHQTPSSSSSATHRHRHRGRHGRHHTRRADDSAGHRRGRGTDDGPNHT
jgi:hypothetical protein